MERFYSNTKFLANTKTELTENEHHHLSRVLRLRIGEETELVNGLGSLARARVVQIEKDRTYVQILSVHTSPPLLPYIMMGIPLMRASKLEWVLEKGTELGCDAFIIYRADRSSQETLSEHQIERLRTITVSALKQSRRLFLPSMEILPSLKSLLTKEAKIFFGNPSQDAPSFEYKADQTTLFITGPESGFSEAEFQILKSSGEGVRLNPNVLRAETAPLVALSLMCKDKK